MRIPGGFSLFESLLASDDQFVARLGNEIPDVSEGDLDLALEALRRGDIEFITLIDGDEMTQAAGEGDGPYYLEHQPTPDGPLTSVDNAPFEVVAVTLRSYRAGDDGWKKVLPPATGVTSPTSPVEEKKGFMSRLFGR